jgi:hypothetical protein
VKEKGAAGLWGELGLKLVDSAGLL